MRCRLYQTDTLRSEQEAERQMRDFLCQLPEGYTIYRELYVTTAFDKTVENLSERRPDFVVVGPQIGLVSIEVKDWNLTRNIYEWQDQYKVRKKRIGTTENWELLDNPAAQARDYGYAFQEQIRDLNVWVTSVVAFPRLSRAEFINKLVNIDILRNPSSRFFLNLETTLFKEDLDPPYLFHPDRKLVEIVRRSRPTFQIIPEDIIDRVNNRILPRTFRVDDEHKRVESHKKLRTISEQQERWIFDSDASSAYLLDVAGSGKTTALVAKAIHVVDVARKHKQNAPRILLTTYNPNLQRNIKRILETRVGDERNTLYKTIEVESVDSIMLRVAASAYGLSVHAYLQHNSPGQPSYDAELAKDVEAAVQDEPSRYQQYDYIFIDEIQDFADAQLALIRQLAKRDRFFFVGDIGQKLYDRYHNLKRHNFEIENLELPKSYRMYRTPRSIGELAYRFIMSDAFLRAEFQDRGYQQDVQFESHTDNAAEILYEQDVIGAVVQRINDLLATRFTENEIMVITSEYRLQSFENALSAASLNYAIGEPSAGRPIRLVDFLNVKGLEKEVVFVTGVEDLFESSKPEATFMDTDKRLREEAFSRRKIYVALTRCLEQCILCYDDPTNPFIKQLRELNDKIIALR